MLRLFEGKKKYILCFVGLFLLEAFLSLWTGHPYDMKVWFQTGQWMDQGINIYAPNDHLGYPPLWAFWCLSAYRLYSFFGNSMEIWRFAIKLPMILAQFLLAYVISRFAESRFDQKTARRIFFYALTWSFIIYIGALWGQINILSTLLTFLAFCAVINQRTTLSALLLGIAVALKIYPLITLPAFFAYILKKQSGKQAGKFLLYVCAVPILFTLVIFAVFQWDTFFFLKTIFYWTPIYESNPVQILGGCMNVWSFVALLNVDTVRFWFLRFVWIPILAVASFYWLRRRNFDEADFNFSLVSLYLLFMISYGWVSEQSFIDALPFIFLQIFAYRPKRLHLYFLFMVQGVIYGFSMVNWGPSIFKPLLERFSPGLLGIIQYFDLSTSSFIWTIRGIMGLIVSLFLGVFLLFLAKPSISKQTFTTLYQKFKSVIGFV